MKPEHKLPDIIFVTGVSGAGRSSALKIFENLGYNIIDNLPCFMLPTLKEGLQSNNLNLPVIVGLDVRSLESGADILKETLEDFRENYKVRLLFLECQTDILLKRYNVSRHRHPFKGLTLLEAIENERECLEPIKDISDHIINTSVISVVTLGRVLRNIFSRPSSPDIEIRVMSFSYRKGIPPEADIVLDARFLENPYYEENLRDQSGLDEDVKKFIIRDKNWRSVFESMKQMLDPTITGFKNSGRSYLTIAIGCTGGQHRSVFIAEQIGIHLKNSGESIHIEHRESSSWHL